MSFNTQVDGVEVTGKELPALEQILTPEALRMVPR